ncbi:cysteine-rich CWC family protein [Mucilaginibacter mali]|uniref:Cysteine-rich CWC family protein n=1 Tax=Mucilaginibacter mali TaxID=2740462 RepID=A0A7D4PV52_9SPHI|nr:cysteine-rich CWC family protein [Mucilaginibacter mali]QKJ31368.1 cysteine-rich CWC family protein [Mucilaginibacter mali]
MAQHEDKHCPRCGKPFECKVGSILLCQCNGITFNDAEWGHILNNYADCLCRDCLLHIRHEIHTLTTQQKLQAILAPIKKK